MRLVLQTRACLPIDKSAATKLKKGCVCSSVSCRSVCICVCVEHQSGPAAFNPASRSALEVTVTRQEPRNHSSRQGRRHLFRRSACVTQDKLHTTTPTPSPHRLPRDCPQNTHVRGLPMYRVVWRNGASLKVVEAAHCCEFRETASDAG